MIALKENDLRKYVAELLVLRASGYLLDSQRQYPQWELENRDLERLLAEGVGGVILFGGMGAAAVKIWLNKRKERIEQESHDENHA